MVCPGCITSEEYEEMAEDSAAVGESLKACAQCQARAPEFTSGVPEDIGWYITARGLVCPSCVTQEEMDTAADKSVRVARRMRGLSNEREED